MCVVGRLRPVSGIAVACMAAVFVLLLAYATPAQADVDLVYFRATAGDNDVLIEWGTGNELTTFGFNLRRAMTENLGDADQINGSMIEAENLGQNVGWDYRYTDSSVDIGARYCYWLEVLDQGGPEFFGPECAWVGGTPTPTPTHSPTATVVPSATPTPTSMPTATWTPTPIETPTFTPASVPSATPTSSLSATPATAPPWTPSPTMTASGTGEPPATSVPTTGDVSPSPTPTSQVVGALTDQPESPERSTQPRATDWRPPGVTWPTVSISAILLLISLISLLGVLFLSTALVLVRKFGS